MNEIIDKFICKIPLTDEEVHQLLGMICNRIREQVGIYDPMDSNCKMCNETSLLFGQLMILRFDHDVERMNIKKLLEIPLTHYANIISINVNGDYKTFLVDMTYSQFFGETITLDDNGKVMDKKVSTKKSFGKIKDKEFVSNLRKYGYVELTGDILIQYIDSLLELCNKKSKIRAYENIEKLLLENKINIKIR